MSAAAHEAFSQSPLRVDVNLFPACAHPPQLLAHDRSGRRIDEVEFHPGRHVLA